MTSDQISIVVKFGLMISFGLYSSWVGYRPATPPTPGADSKVEAWNRRMRLMNRIGGPIMVGCEVILLVGRLLIGR